MGQSKLLLPWGNTTVIAKVIMTLVDSGIKNIHVITGSNHDAVEDALAAYDIDFHHNAGYERGEMLSSVKIGIHNLENQADAAMIVLGDQPQIEAGVVRALIDRYTSGKYKIIIPSFEMHRGHPWIIDRYLWNDVLNLGADSSLRQYLNKMHDEINYVIVGTSSVLMDLDTPEEYNKYKP
jgi:molybdenum cofactor cytidylyltransferase